MDKTTPHEVSLGRVEKIPLGQGFCFVVDKEEIAIFRPRTGGIFAIANRCPHRQGPLCDGVLDPQRVVCPYHHHKFDIRTGEGSEMGEKVKIYKVREESGNIFLEI
jgi:nitrite reductase (NADH) small subunit